MVNDILNKQEVYISQSPIKKKKAFTAPVFMI